MLRSVLTWSLLAGLAAGCSGSVGSTPAPGPSAPSSVPPGTIAHIVVLVQENRSFDNIFAGFPGANTSMQGLCKPARTPSFYTWWCKSKHRVPLHPVTLESTGTKNRGEDIDHSRNGFEIECDRDTAGVCRMDGFDLIRQGEEGGGPVAKRYPYAYVDRTESKPYWDLARRYTLADDIFFNETASSFIAHQILISGSVRLNDRSTVTDQPYNAPWGCKGEGGSPAGDTAPTLDRNGTEDENGRGRVFPCFRWPTIADLLDAKSISWTDYVDTCCPQTKPFDFSGGVWNGFRAIAKIRYGPDWKTNISSPNTNVFSDLANGALPSIAWVIPTLYDSDHPASGCNGGPWWVTKVVNAVGTSKYWNDTAIILLWDDWGGWYDNVPPKRINYHQLGFRVPMIVISPYARPKYVSHSYYNFDSILKLMEDTFGLGSLGTADATAPSMNDVFDFTQPPLTFKPARPPKALPCKDKLTNYPQKHDGMQELIEHDGGVPE